MKIVHKMQVEEANQKLETTFTPCGKLIREIIENIILKFFAYIVIRIFGNVLFIRESFAQ